MELAVAVPQQGFMSLSQGELDAIDAGAWSWSTFGDWAGTTAAAGGVAGGAAYALFGWW
nr:hypothetical protein [Bacilli bacterium]